MKPVMRVLVVLVERTVNTVEEREVVSHGYLLLVFLNSTNPKFSQKEEMVYVTLMTKNLKDPVAVLAVQSK